MIDPHDGAPDAETPAEPDYSNGRVRDPGSAGARVIAWLAALALIPVVIVMQQCEGVTKKPGGPAPAAAAAEKLPDFDQFSIMGRMMIKLVHATGDQNRALARQVMPQLEGKTGGEFEPKLSTLDRVRAAIAAGELLGPDEAVQRLEAIDFAAERAAVKEVRTIEDDAARAADAESRRLDLDELARDAGALVTFYRSGEDALSPGALDRIVDRQGWWGQLAASFGKPDSDPVRQDILSGGMALMAVLLLAGLVVIGGILAGFALSLAMIVMIATGKIRPRFVPPIPGGSVYLEVLPVFVLGFACLKFVGTDLVTALLAQWALVPFIFWPLLRGARWTEFRRAVGYTSGRGVFREIGCGIFGYLAGLPLFLLAVAIAVLVVFVQAGITAQHTGEAPAPPDNKVLDILTQAKPPVLALFFCLATFWAPIVEEAVFRGALYRHLRGRVHFTLAAGISAVLFGVMHGYPVPLLLPVITLGFNFALMREWRGSLIAPMTAHALHNGTLVAIMISVISVLR